MSVGTRFAGRGAIVTGAGKGLGRAMVAGLVKEGCQCVIGITRSAEDCVSLEAEFPNAVKAVCADLGVEPCVAMDKAISLLENAQCELYYLVNNAGINVLESVLGLRKESWDKVMSVNAFAPIVCTQKAVRKMVTDVGGSIGGDGCLRSADITGIQITPDQRSRLREKAIVNISSQASLFSLDSHCSYSMSKAAVDLLTKTCALELGDTLGIRCNAVNPTVILTKLGKAAWGDPSKGGPMLRKIPLGRFAEEADVVGPVLFLLDAQLSGMVNGTLLPVEGGICSACKM